MKVDGERRVSGRMRVGGRRMVDVRRRVFGEVKLAVPRVLIQSSLKLNFSGTCSEYETCHVEKIQQKNVKF